MDKKAVITALGALAQESRLDIFRLLVETGPDGLMMGAIGEKLGLPHAETSWADRGRARRAHANL